ncbi:MAG: lysophospholipid acyltransferase family protein [Cypionkella sp.]|nr:lysophospholipid acyltransferase family protein [Cypionkella sp.]
MPNPIRHAIQWVMSLIFIIQMYLAMAVVATLWLPRALISRQGAADAAHAYCAWVKVSARVLCGLKSEVRGTPPKGQVLVAGKHHSFLDIILIYSAIPRGKFIMKAELRFAPFLGWYALRMGCVPVFRGKRGAAIAKMLAAVASGREMPGQMVIYPQGTRVHPDAKLPYKRGTGALYTELGQPCVPVATNAGVFWPKRGIMRQRGTAVVQFLEEIPANLTAEDFMARIEAAIEPVSDALVREGRGQI